MLPSVEVLWGELIIKDLNWQKRKVMLIAVVLRLAAGVFLLLTRKVKQKV